MPTDYDQESVYAWLEQARLSESGDPEGILDYVGSALSGALQGATTGLAAGGPWGALIGGLAGAGLGAATQAMQPKPASSSPAPPKKVALPPAPQAATKPTQAAKQQPGAPANQQINQVMNQLSQLLQQLLPVVAALQKSQAKTTEAADVSSLDPLAGDFVPESYFGETESLDVTEPEAYTLERIEPTETNEETSSPTVSSPAAQPPGSFNSPYPGQWIQEAEVAMAQPAPLALFEWVT